MADFGTMVSRILTDLNRGSTQALQDRAKLAIIDAITFYRGKRLGWNTRRAETDINPGDEYVALPEDWVEVDNLRLELDGHRDPFEEVGYSWIEDNLRDDTQKGRPYKFAIQARELRLYPIADRSYSLAMTFMYALTDVSISASDGATNGWTEEGDLLIRTHAQGDLMVRYIGGEAIQGGMALLQLCRDEILPNFEREAAREQTAGAIRPRM